MTAAIFATVAALEVIGSRKHQKTIRVSIIIFLC